jgi:hypothetical protein
MIKRSLLSSSIALATIALTQQVAAAPLLPIDARGLAMGSTGVASAKLAHAPQYNPALLSTANDDDDFAIIFPQFGVIVADEDKFIETAEGLTEDDYKNFDESLIDHFTTITENLTDSLDSLENDIAALTIPSDLTTLSVSEIDDLKSQTASLQTSLEGFTDGTADLKETTFDLTSKFDQLSASGLRVNAGLNAAIAIPGKTLGAAISFNTNVLASGRTIFSDEDQNLINAYAEGVNEYATLTTDYVAATNNLITSVEAFNDNPSTENEQALTANEDIVNAKQDELDDFTKEANGQTIISVNGGNIVVDEDPELTSLAHVVAIAISELGLTLSHSFKIGGENIAIGITPKLQTIKTFNYVTLLENDDEIDEEDVKDTEQDFSDFNLDMGIAYQFGADDQWQAGLVAKNLLSKEYEAESNGFGPKKDDDGNLDVNGKQETLKTTISLDTQFRGGISHTTDWTVVAFDLDLMENDPVAFEAPTQYASIGAELDLLDLFQLRGGYRTNLSVSDSSIVSAGLGFSPFGVHMDLAVMANPSDPEKEVGAAFELGFYF